MYFRLLVSGTPYPVHPIRMVLTEVRRVLIKVLIVLMKVLRGSQGS